MIFENTKQYKKAVEIQLGTNFVLKGVMYRNERAR